MLGACFGNIPKYITASLKYVPILRKSAAASRLAFDRADTA